MLIYDKTSSYFCSYFTIQTLETGNVLKQVCYSSRGWHVVGRNELSRLIKAKYLLAKWCDRTQSGYIRGS